MIRKIWEMIFMSSSTKKAKKQAQLNAVAHAREVYEELGSVKKTAKALNKSKAETKKLLGKKWIDEKHQARLAKNPRIDAFPQKRKLSTSSMTYAVKRTSIPKTTKIDYSKSGSIHTSTSDFQRIQKKGNVVKTKLGIFEIVKSTAWGRGLVPVEEEVLDVSLEDICKIDLPQDFPKIPSHLWARWIDLCFHFCNKVDHTKLEVSVLFCRNAKDMTQWRLLVPKQSVSGAHVRAQVGPCIDIATGERFEQFPPPGWKHAGSSHSHNTMDAFFSGTDNASELSVPGLHIVVGRIDSHRNTYTQKASIVIRKLRKHVEFLDVVDATPTEGFTFHSDVLDYISTAGGGEYTWGAYWHKNSQDNFKPSAMELLDDEKPDFDEILSKVIDPERLTDYFHGK